MHCEMTSSSFTNFLSRTDNIMFSWPVQSHVTPYYNIYAFVTQNRSYPTTAVRICDRLYERCRNRAPFIVRANAAKKSLVALTVGIRADVAERCSEAIDLCVQRTCRLGLRQTNKSIWSDQRVKRVGPYAYVPSFVVQVNEVISAEIGSGLPAWRHTHLIWYAIELSARVIFRQAI